jgi:hypothetical protein
MLTTAFEVKAPAFIFEGKHQRTTWKLPKNRARYVTLVEILEPQQRNAFLTIVRGLETEDEDTQETFRIALAPLLGKVALRDVCEKGEETIREETKRAITENHKFEQHWKEAA